MGDIRHDLRHAWRALLKNPGFTLVALLTLAIGIGANTAIFSVVNAVLLKPLPFPEADRLVRVYEGTTGGLETASPPNFADWRNENTAFDEMGAYVMTMAAVSGAGEARRLTGSAVTAGFFPVLASPPLLGRTISAADAVEGRHHVVVLSHALWQRQYHGDPEILGRTLRLDGRDHTVIGIMRPDFAYPAPAAFWVPLPFSETDLATQRGAHYLDVIARLAPGITIEEASSQMAAIADVLEARHPDTNTGSSAGVIGMKDALVGEVRPALLMLLGAVGFVLLIACGNVANLLLARMAARRRELAVRNALGAGRHRLVRLVLTESVLLSIGGGVAGVLLAMLGLEVLLALPIQGVPRLEHVRLDFSVLAFTAAVSLFTGLLFGLLPALKACLVSDLTAALKSGGAAATTDREGGRTRRALVVAEMALAVLLLFGAGLLLRSFIELQSVDPGFNAQAVLTFDIALPSARYPEPQQARAFFAELQQQVATLPGVEGVGSVFGLPLSGFNYVISVERMDGAPAYDRPGNERYTQVRVVTPSYFQVMEIPLLAGRMLTDQDRAGAGPAVLVNESAAKLLWPGRDPLAHELELGTTLGVGAMRVGGPVVGVVADVRHAGLDAHARPEVYVTHSQFPVDLLSVVVRTSVPPQSLVPAIRERLHAIDSELPFDDVRTMEQRVAASVAQPRLTMFLLGIFALAALFLAAIGIYGVLAYAVRQRSNEIGVRRALGAPASHVMRMVVGQAMTLAGAGLVIGLLAAFGVTRLLTGFLYGVSATDPATVAVVTVLLAMVALLASVGPARRAVRLDPMKALREE